MALALGLVSIVTVGAVGLRMLSDAPAAAVPVPDKIVGAYLENWITVLPRDLPAGNNLLFSAFATINADGSVAYEPEQSPGSLKADIATRNAAGKPTILSVGGAGGAKSGLNTSSEQQAFLNSIRPIIDAYGFSGIDWDIESGVSISVPGMAAVSRSLVNDYGSAFAITMAPYDETEDTYKQLAKSIRDIVTFVGYQFYNGNAAPTSASVLKTMDSWIADTGISPAQFAIGFMPTDDSGKSTPYTTMASIYQAVAAKYPTVRGSWTWAVEADKVSGYKFVSTMTPVVGPPTTIPNPTPPTPPTPSPGAKTGDLNRDSKVNLSDLSLMLTNWSKTGTNICDLNGDGKVGLQDLSTLLTAWTG